MTSFGFEDFCAGDGFAKGFKDNFEGFGGTAFRGLSETAGRTETFLTGAEAKAGAGTRGTETEAGVTLAVGTFGIVGIAEPEAEAGTGIGIALGMEAFSCARLNKSSR
jgi:hypothetical protein